MSDVQSEDYQEVAEFIHRSITNNREENVLTRLSTITKQMSHLNAKGMESFQLKKEDFDLHTILDFIARKSDEQGTGGRFTNVEFEDLTVIGKNESTQFVPSVGDIFFAPFMAIKDKLSSKPKLDLKNMDKERRIINNVNGLVESGQMLLVLGRPGAGCSTFLKSIAGETQTYIRTEGDLTFNGIDGKDMFKRFKNEIVYNPELDVHFPYLTVDQTLKFAIGCKTPNIRIDNMPRSEYINSMRDLWSTVFGLSHVLHTLVGSEFVRGVSGGQRKRVSIAEAMSTRASVFCFDNATRGLDASTALEFAEALRIATNISKCVSIVTAYQASESIYNEFDLVTVLHSGRQIYFGPADEAKNYFVRMGFYCPPRQVTPEFLTAVTDPLGRTLRPDVTGPVPYSADEFEKYWLESPEYARLRQSITLKKQQSDPSGTFDKFHRISNMEKMKYVSSNSKYTINYIEQLKLCFTRGTQKMINNSAYTYTMCFSAVFQSLIVGSLYYNTPNETLGAFSRGGVIFFALLFYSLMALAETAAIFDDKPILTKQRGYSFFHPSAELISSIATQIPVKFVSSTIFSIIIYFLSNLKREPGPFFAFVLFLNICVTAINCFFVLLASVCPSLSAANALTGIFLIPTIVYSSFMIQRPSMVPWFKWYSYMNPILYAFESMITMEFHGREMECSPFELIPNGKGYSDISTDNQVCAFASAGSSTTVNGDNYLKVQFQYSFSHCWRNLGILILFILGYLAINIAIVEYFNPIASASDKLLFTKHAKVDPALIEALNNGGNLKRDLENDAESSSNGSFQIKDKAEFAATEVNDSNDLSSERLGSDDIFSWQNVDYVIPYDGGKRKLLDNVSGYVKPGQLTALMGESGAGKTTLLNALSQRIDFGVVSGDMLVNGNPLNRSFERRTGYVQQQDLHIAQLTVRESLIFAARLRRPMSVPDSEKIAYVDKIMEILHMEPYSDALAGELGFGLNVEQRKKLSIATELVAKPSLLLFLDEPTSGLDSQSAWSIVKVMKQLAAAGQAILCTIHQPSATLFEEFDRLLLLKKGGQTVYFGEVGKNSETMLEYFHSNGARICQPHENPAEYILEVIGAGATASVDEDWHDIWNKSSQVVKVEREIKELLASKKHVQVSEDELVESRFVTSYSYQFKMVLGRTFLQFYRDVDYIMAKFMLLLIGGLLVGFTFFNVKHTTVGLQNTLFAQFLPVILGAPLMNQIQAHAIQSRELYEVRESKSNTFHWSTLLLSQYINEIPYGIIFSTVFFVAYYFAVQYDNSPAVAGFWWFTYCFLYQFYYTSLGLWFIYMAPDLPSANVLISLALNFIIAFCGVVQNTSLMPGFWKFMWRASPMTYFIDNLLSTIQHGREVHCSESELSYLTPPDGQTCGTYLVSYFENNPGYVENPNDTSRCGVCPYRVGDEYLATVGMGYSHRWPNVGYICVFIIFNVFAMIFFYWLFRVSKFSFTGIFKIFQKKKKKPVAVKKEEEEEVIAATPEPVLANDSEHEDEPAQFAPQINQSSGEKVVQEQA